MIHRRNRVLADRNSNADVIRNPNLGIFLRKGDMMLPQKYRGSRCLSGACLALVLFLPVAPRAEELLVALPGAMIVSGTPQHVVTSTLALVVDFAMVLQVEGEIGSIVLGNAGIADALVTDGQMIVLTGKSVGMTNMIVLDTASRVLTQMTLQVSGRKPGTVVVRRALELQSYACSSGLCTSGPDAETEVAALAEVPL